MDDEVALFYGRSETCPGSSETVAELLDCLAARGERAVAALARKIYRPERRPVCGDGSITGFEQCDPAAFPTGCSFFDVCHPQGCFCVESDECGNGLIELGEDCDYATFPSGCPFDKFCNDNCVCQVFGSASAAFLNESRDLLE